MGKVSTYLEAESRRSYGSALRHFEEKWGGFLPATPESVARSPADRAEIPVHNTLERRLAALARRHTDQGLWIPPRPR